MFFSAFALDRYMFLAHQTVNSDVAGIAAKAVKELHYHWEHAAQWVIRLGDGTPESQHKVQDSVDHLWAFTGEFFVPDDVDTACTEAGLMPDLRELESSWHEKVAACLKRATLRVPEKGWTHQGGKQGMHSEHLSYMLAEMQVLPRTYPDAKW